MVNILKLIHSLVNLIKQYGKTTSFIMGCFFSMGLPPYFASIYIFSLSIFLFLINQEDNSKKAFSLGYSFGYGHFLSSIYWMGNSVFVDFSRFWFVYPFAVFGIPLVLAFYIAISTYFYKKIKGNIISFACLWVIFEYIRTYLFTGLPWPLAGYMLVDHVVISQIASVFGIYGLSFLVIILGSMPYYFYYASRKKIVVFSFIAMIGAIYSYGNYHIYKSNFEHLTMPKVAIIQPNIEQTVKWDRKLAQAHLKKLVDLSIKYKNEADYIIWPESAIPYYLHQDDKLYFLIGSLPEKGVLISGALRIKSNTAVTNSLFVFDKNGRIVTFYDKNHLVPFGEYIPAFVKFIFPFIHQSMGMGDIDYHNERKSISYSNFPPFAPIICYESIFPNELISNKTTDFKWIVNITNDGWFGLSVGPYQHFHMSRVRAIETGKGLVRAANTGISGIIDTFGRIVYKTTLGTEESFIETVPLPLANKTIYSLIKDLFVGACLIYILLEKFFRV